MSLLKDEEVLGSRVNRIARTEKSKLNKLTRYIQTIYDEVDKQDSSTKKVSVKDAVQEFVYFFIGSGKRPRIRGIFPNEGPGMGYYYKNFEQQLKQEETDLSYSQGNMRFIFPSDMEYRKRITHSRFFQGGRIKKEDGQRKVKV